MKKNGCLAVVPGARRAQYAQIGQKTSNASTLLWVSALIQWKVYSCVASVNIRLNQAFYACFGFIDCFFNLFKAGFPLVTIILVHHFVERMKSKIKCKYWLLILYRLQFVGPSLFQRMHSGSVQLQLKEKKTFFSLWNFN